MDIKQQAYSNLVKLAAQMAMKQNMPNVEQVTHSVNIPKKTWRSLMKMFSKSTQQCNDWAYELRKNADLLNSQLSNSDGYAETVRKCADVGFKWAETYHKMASDFAKQSKPVVEKQYRARMETATSLAGEILNLITAAPTPDGDRLDAEYELIGEVVMCSEPEWVKPQESFKWLKTEFPLGTKIYAVLPASPLIEGK